MRVQSIYPQNFGDGIPNPIGLAVFSALEKPRTQLSMPEYGSPLVSFQIPYKGPTILSNLQYDDVRMGADPDLEAKQDRTIREQRDNVREKAKDFSLGWSHTKEWEKNQIKSRLQAKEQAKLKKQEEMSEEEKKIEIERKRKIIKDTQRLLKYERDRYGELRGAMVLSQAIKEREELQKLREEKAIQEKVRLQEEERIYLEHGRTQAEVLKEKEVAKKQFELEWEQRRKEQIVEKARQKEIQKKVSAEELALYKSRADKEIAAIKKQEEIDSLKKRAAYEDKQKQLRESKEKKEKEMQRDLELKEKARQQAENYEVKKAENQMLVKGKIQRVQERQEKAFQYRLDKFGGRVDITDELNQKYLEEQERKLFEKALEERNKNLVQEKELVADYDYVKELREKQKNKEKEESKKELETYKANKDQAIIDERDKKEKLRQEKLKLREFWVKQIEERKSETKHEADWTYGKVCSTLRKYDIEDDELEIYAENLIRQKQSEGLNVYPIVKAKKAMGLGRNVPLVAVDGKIRLYPRVANPFYRPEDSRERLSLNWGRPGPSAKVAIMDKPLVLEVGNNRPNKTDAV